VYASDTAEFHVLLTGLLPEQMPPQNEEFCLLAHKPENGTEINLLV